MVLRSRFYSSMSWSNKRRVDKLQSLYEKYFNKEKVEEHTTTNVVELKEDFIAQTVLFNEPKFVIGYSVYVENGMPKMNVIEKPPPEHGKGCKCNSCIIANVEEIDKIIKKRNKK